MRSGPPEGTIEPMLPMPDSELSVVIDGPRTAEIWCGPSLLGIVDEQHGVTVLRLESHARGPLTVNTESLERALARVRELSASVRV